VTGRNISYAIGCTNESSTATGGAIAPLRYITIAEDVDTAKTITNIAIASNIATLTSNAHSFDVGDVVVVEGLSQKEGNGAFVIVAVTANTFDINLTKAAAGSAASASNVANVSDLGSSAAAGGATARRVIEAIQTLDSTRVSFSGTAPFSMSVNPNATLPGNTALNAQIMAGALRDARSNSFAAINSATAWNFTTAEGSASIVNITSSTANGSYRTGGGTAPSIQVRFNQPVTVAGVPELLLNAGADAVATYASGSGTKTLTFTYTLGAGHSTLLQSGQKLNVTGINLPAGATMSGVTASTPLPVSGAVGSLNANKSIKIDNTAPTPQGFMPFPSAVGVQATQALNIIFGENMSAVTDKRIFIYTSAGVLHETITIGTESNVAVTQFPNNSGAMVTITRLGKGSTVNLVTDPATIYYVTYEAGAFADLAGNTTAALTSTTAWRFEASPDTVAPTFNPNQSDPPHNMATFTIDRNIELAFSEAVSTVATKTIRLCTGDADCATPVETFTLPSASVTSSGGGLRVVINPTANLSASTTYFLLIDSGAFVDGAGNPTAGAVTAGQYQFTTAAAPVPGAAPVGPPAGGSLGGPTGPPIAPIIGGPAACGPPPLPPCNVGPGINFGPGGIIQNPNALNGSDMVNLRPDNFVAFRPDDARSLGAGALQNFQPSQFGALPPTAMAGFDRNQINNLNPAAMAGMNNEQLRALPPSAMQGFRPDQMAQLPPSAMAGFDPTRMAALPPEAMQGFRPDQMSQLPPAAMAGISANQMGQLPPSAMSGFNANQFAVLPPNAMTAFKPDQMAQLPPAAMTGMKLDQFKVLPPTAITGMQESQFAALPPQAMIGFKPQQFAALPPDAISGMQQNQFKVIPPNAMKVFTPTQMDAMPIGALAVISPSQFKALTPEVIASMSPEQRSALPLQAFNPAANAAPTNIANAAALAGVLTGWNVDKVPASAFANFKPADAAKLSPQVFGSLNPEQFKAMPPAAFTGMKPSQVGALPPEVLAAMKPTQFASMPAAALSSMNTEQFTAMPPTAFSAMKPAQVGAMPPELISNMSPKQVGALPPTAIAGLKPDQLTALPPEAMATMKPTQVAAFTPAAVGSLSAEQVGALPAVAFGAMKPTQVGALPLEAMATMSAQQVGALPPKAMAGLKADQVEAMPDEVIATLKPKQMAELSPKSAAGFSVEKLAALTPAQEKALKPAFINALTPEQKAALNS